MHDLNTINKINFDAFAESVNRFRASGRWVLTRKEGLHLVGIETFASADELSDAHHAAVSKAGPGETYQALAPLPAFHAAARDQSEDRGAVSLDELVALGRRSVGDPEPAERTLGDYIARKSD
jgi:hypothetical protein